MFVNSMIYLLSYKDVVSSSQANNIYSMHCFAFLCLDFKVCWVGGVTYIQNQRV